MTPLQVLWSVLVVPRADNRRLLIAGAAGNLAIATVWVISRIVGLPFGPNPFQPEAVGFKDLLATYDEFAVVLLVVLLLRGRNVRPWMLVPVWVIVVASVLAAMLPGAH